MRARKRIATGGVVSAAVAAVLLAGAGAGAAPSGAPRAIDCSVAKCVALTFDDGPGTQIPTLLNMLKAAGAHATFFVVGEMATQRPEALKQIAAAGDEIGDHSWSHPDLRTLSDDDLRSQITRTADVVEDATGIRPELMRPPYGDLNQHVRQILAQRDWPIILWTVDPEDWKDRNSDTVYERVVSGTRPGAIVLMHDIHPTTVAAVPRILAALKREGYTFVTVSQLYGHDLTPGKTYSGRVQAERELTPSRRGDPTGQPEVRHGATDGQQRPAPVAGGQQEAGQGDQPGHDQQADDDHAARVPAAKVGHHTVESDPAAPVEQANPRDPTDD
ncbi:MAG TPA: polysaccharide deacetylase family protein [Sporichthyaceae bacterium]|nr:polysaccharide deacetylase family protein [Sporichthyaceae bacterium]